MRRTQVKDDGLPGHCVSQVKNHHFPCGRSSYQSKGYSTSIWMYLIFDLSFAGGDNFSCQVSQTHLPIFGAVGFWKQHHSLRRGGMEKVPNDHRSGLLGGMYRAVEVDIFSTRSLEKYSSGMGRNRPHHVRPIRQCLGRQSRNRVGSLRRYHPSGRSSVDSPARLLRHLR